MSNEIANNRSTADHFRSLARAMIGQARMLKAAGDIDLARELAERARAFDHLGWSYVAPVQARIRA